MTRTISLEVLGTPKPKGSPKVVTRGRGGKPLPFPRVLHDSPESASWAAEVGLAARRAMHEQPMFTGHALMVRVVFRLVRPAGHYGKRGLLPSAPRFPATKPDLDKLIRNTMDPLEGVVFDGDSRIAAYDARKVYCEAGEPAGADITVELLEAPAEQHTASQPSLLALGGA
jgi:Holliday junction resolvase RusA-like endonuclease